MVVCTRVHRLELTIQGTVTFEIKELKATTFNKKYIKNKCPEKTQTTLDADVIRPNSGEQVVQRSKPARDTKNHKI
jgi:hypothetical protein